MKDLLIHLGAKVQWDKDVMVIDSTKIQSIDVSDEIMRRLRASNLVLGALLGRFGRVRISYPGGCQIGSRPMDLHVKGLRQMGARIHEKFGYITAEARRLTGAEIHLDVPSVGATENLMMAAVLADGVTTIRNVAKEPEMTDLQNYLNQIGAKVTGAGTDTIKITGVNPKYLKPADYSISPDRIEAGPYIVSAALTGGDVTVTNVVPEHLEPLLAKLREGGVEISHGRDYVRVRGSGRFKAVDLKTMPYPGFPTDMQPQMMALLSLAEGTSVITESIFENRFKHVGELRRMGANIQLEGRTAIIKGVQKLSGTCLETSDLRAGAALVMAALASEGTTVLERISHIDRGYERLEDKYKALGARIIRV
jgi:UDP-N-acetylglucosamine 1-carboxyvinyltransferase